MARQKMLYIKDKNDDTWTEAERIAAERGISESDYVAEALAAHNKKQAVETANK